MMRTLPKRRIAALLAVFACVWSLAPDGAGGAPRSRRKPGKSQAVKNLPELKTPEDKIRFLEMIRNTFPAIRSGTPNLSSITLDEILDRYVTDETSTPLAEVVDDETFLRRVSLDLAGQIPTPGGIRRFVSSTDKRKRSLVIDELLETDQFARKQARYWRSVVFHDSGANRNMVNPQAFEDWLFEEFKAGTGWDRIVGEMVSATPRRQKDVKAQDNGWQQDYGPNNFVLACENKPEVMAAQTARLFMGISIGCAECHDHPFDDWQREQFHELAAFFAPGKYFMSDQYDPSQRTEMEARFLLGEEPPLGLKPDQRRVAGAAYLIYNPDNHWFARAFVNRVWSELLGDGFYAVDSLGPDKEVVHQLVINRIAASFRYSEFDVKWLFRLICNSQAYQREIRTIEDEADLFTAVRPSRLRSWEVADCLEIVIGKHEGLRNAVTTAFEQNPSIPQQDLEGSLQQALLLMNNTVLQQRIADSPLKKELLELDDDQEVIRHAFLGVLARTPTTDETARYVSYFKQIPDRREAVEDLIWVLINSAEFTTKR
ncbi:MAG: DUF1549 domain-containing protein [Planctomycetota bacterium]|nr:MAG: DUF1549 domain-containing protein [Planctomycetota bacterium]REK22126.1 MAG: DUF1549 domain-containing protein [Planctomycetota bacterium]REK34938.1 MAG: DUF1549 domain-containing protein [Planctomycetota bacterium]